MRESPPPSDNRPERHEGQGAAGDGAPDGPPSFQTEPTETLIVPGGSSNTDAHGPGEAFAPPEPPEAADATATSESQTTSYNIPKITINLSANTPEGKSRTELSTDASGGMKFTDLPGGLHRVDRTFNIRVNGLTVVEKAFIIVDANGDIVESKEYEEPPRESLFTFARPYAEGYEPVGRAEQGEARMLMDGIHGAVSGRYPDNRVANALTPGLSSNTIRKKDVTIMSTTCEPDSPFVKHYGLRSVQLAERAANKTMGDVVQYVVDGQDVPRRWHTPAPSPNEGLRRDWEYGTRRSEAKKEGPAAVARVEAEIFAERMASLQPDKQLAARNGENFLPVGVEEVRAMGRFVGEKLGIADDMRRIIG